MATVKVFDQTEKALRASSSYRLLCKLCAPHNLFQRSRKSIMSSSTADLQCFLKRQFSRWSPTRPRLVSKTKGDVTLCWTQEDRPFGFLVLTGDLIYRVYVKSKLPPWTLVYSGGKTLKNFDNLASSYHYIYRLQIILKSESVSKLSERCLHYYGSENAIYEAFNEKYHSDTEVNKTNSGEGNSSIDEFAGGDTVVKKLEKISVDELSSKNPGSWLCSDFSEETGVTTDSAGTNAACFCMAVKCGYIKQLQQMLEEKPSLIETINVSNGQTPLTTAVLKGDLATVSYLIQAGADVNQVSAVGQAPLHLALLSQHLDIVTLLLDKGARIDLRDKNGLRGEHYAADSGCVEVMKLVLSRGGDLEVMDSNGWTPLFRAVCQGASPEMIEELVSCGANVAVRDNAGLPLADAARLIKDKRGQPLDSVMRLVDSKYPREVAMTHFTRLTKKITRVHSLFKH